ncbi:clathrin-coated vesicle protein [Histoplasma capsulatum G186AR]|uniref:Clathrin-coated vesicle protein n=1 Tax=Ajellomyces capsulatus TaxID=5037 RepID=A0A8H7Z897_AJECA|nr:clathrin-coated vesicle protein [Histoplasma capsulatum]QSS69597.1 clathrin-coated vesicle protein [Histoplasma capsulatum G186AR]
MFSSALKSFGSNIASNYQLSPHPSFTSGPWKVYDGKKKSTGIAASVFVFDRKFLEALPSGLGSRPNSSSLKKLHDEVVERLKREASSLTRLRHPSILQVLEPVEETRNGGLMFATEPVTTSLAGLLGGKDDQKQLSRGSRRAGLSTREDSDVSGNGNSTELDEIEVQKGLLQIAKGLAFLHESAGLVHGNLTPEAIYINAKSDWKISGLAFAGPADTGSQSPLPPLALSEVLYQDPRLPAAVQLNLDYTSPDFVMDSNISTSADLFSLGLIIVTLYNYPHTSPLKTHGNPSTYKKLLSSPSTIPSQSNGFLASGQIPKDLSSFVLPRLITRRPAQRMDAKEFQQSQYFDNILMSTIRFLESLPAKTANEKTQFMKGLGRILPEFSSSVLERKVLVALLDESKDKELLPLILSNVFKIIKIIPSGPRVVPEKVLPHLKSVLLPAGAKTSTQDRDHSKDASLMVVLENMELIANTCSGRDFKNDVLPLVRLGLESGTHSLVDASMRCLPVMLPILDFSTVKDDIFPPIASVFTRTSSLAIKVRGLESFVILCGGSIKEEPSTSGGDFVGMSSKPQQSKSGSASILDKYTVQDKLVPLLKAIKTKEPAVMMAALNVFRQVGQIAETEFIALEIIPTLWNFSLGPLLNVQQFGGFMDLIKSLSSKVEQQQMKKLQSLSSSNDPGNPRSSNPNLFGMMETSNGRTNVEGTRSDFESLVLGKKATTSSPDNTSWNSWDTASSNAAAQNTINSTPQFTWSTVNSVNANNSGGRNSLANLSGPSHRSITPDMSINSFPTLAPTAAQQQPSVGSSFPTLQPSRPSQPSQPSQPSPLSPCSTMTPIANSNKIQQPTSIMNQYSTNQIYPLTSAASTASPSTSSFGQNLQPTISLSQFSIPPPPPSNFQQQQQASHAPLSSSLGQQNANQNQQPYSNSGQISPALRLPINQQKQGLDRYESLL